MAGTIVVDRIESDSSYSSTINVASKVNFTGGMQIGGQDSAMSGFKNKIQNGDFRIFQRTTSNTNISVNTAGVANTATHFGPDRFKSYWYNANNQWIPSLTIQQTRDHPSFGASGTCLEYVCTTAAAMPTYASGGLCFASILYHPEAQDVMELISDSRKPFTISFWVKSNKIGTYSTHVRIPSPTGTSGNIIRAYTINQANTWEKKILVFPSSSTAGCANITSPTSQGLGIEWMVAGNYTPAVDSGLNAVNEQWGLFSSYGISSTGQVNLLDTVGNYFRITDIQLEIGTVATEFERRPYSVELAMCQRYFEVFNFLYNAENLAGQAESVTIGMFGLPFKVTKRSTPSLANVGMISLINSAGSGTAAATFAGLGGSPEHGRFMLTTASSFLTAGNATLAYTPNPSGAFITISSEL